MSLPLFQFRNQQGEVLNLSAVEERERVSKAELYHSIDVAEGVWCRRAKLGC